MLERLSIVLDLFASIGGVVFIPAMILCLAIGIYTRKKLSGAAKIVLFCVAAVLYSIWYSAFTFPVQLNPTQTVYLVAGWDYTDPAQAYLTDNPHLSTMTPAARNEALVKAFKLNPDLVWEGRSLTFARWLGTLSMGLVVLCLGLFFGRRAAPAAVDGQGAAGGG